MISVIIPVYNLISFVGKTLESVFAQTYRDLEVIVVDDGSTDGTGEFLDAYALREPRLRVLHKVNGGVSAARLDGMKAASGEYVGFVDGDDLIEPEMFERLLRNAEKYGADISHCAHVVERPDGSKKEYYGTGELLCETAQEAVGRLLAGKFEPSLCTKLFRRSLIEKMLSEGKYDADVCINEDLLVNYLLFSAAEKTVFEDVCLYRYMKREGSASTSALNERQLKDPVKVRRLIAHDSEGKVYEGAAKAALLEAYRNSYNSVICSGDKRFSEYGRELRELIRKEKAEFTAFDFITRVFFLLLTDFPIVYGIIYKFYRKVR